MPLTMQTRELAREIITRYPKPRSALLPMLHLVQSDEGYVSPEGVSLCAEELGLTKAEVGAVATFYTMFKRRPIGDHLVSVCTNLSCQILGGDEIFACLSEHLGVGHNETTENGRISLEHAECLAACDYAPVVTVNYEFYDHQTPDSALRIVQDLEAGGRPDPTRGAPLVDFRAMSLQLAGFVDEEAVQETSGPAAAPAHPDAPPPVDSRGTVDIEGTDVASPPGAGEYGVPGGVTESTLSDQAAADTYVPAEGHADAGAAGSGGAPTPHPEGDRSMNTADTAGHRDVSAFATEDTPSQTTGFRDDEEAPARDEDST